MSDHHFEPYVSLPDVTHESVLVAWGGFYFRLGGAGDDEWLLVDDEDLHHAARGRSETMGARAEPFGHGVVEVLDDDGDVVSRAESDTENFVWIRGLQPDTWYRYRITVDGEPWAEGQLYDWVPQGGGTGGLRRSERSYDHRFRTHPHPEQPAELTFAVIGDYGWGIRLASEEGLRQQRVAEALEHAVDTRDVRVVLTAGDNIYLGPESTPDATGREDDDWFFTYYQPYRYVINRVPVYPSVGNHDSSDEEASDDREQLADNFFLDQRFGPEVQTRRTSVDPGLFYRFRFGRDVEFLAIDTSMATELDETRFFDHPKHIRFLEDALPDRDGNAAQSPRWSIPFCHHPPFCAGPHHPNTEALVERLLPLARRSGVRLVISGHEHNFQHSVVDDIHFVITGAAGQLRKEPPTRFDEAHTRSWAAEGHFLLVEVDEDHLTLHPVRGRGDDDLELIVAHTPDGGQESLPIVVRHDRWR